MRGIIATLATVWRIASPYFRSEERWAGRLLLAAIIAIELGIVAITVLINQWNARFYNALQDRNWDRFVYELGYFCVLATIFIIAAVYQLYLNQWLQIRWRRWMTRTYLDRWLDGSNHYRMQLLGDAADNPDQRIAEDIRLFIEGGILPLGLGLLNSIVTLGSFSVILWGLSAAAPLHLFGVAWNIPGYLFWAALLYAILGTALTHWIGKPLVALNFQQQRYEADFRFSLVRVRENAEQIALLEGEQAERNRLLGRFARLADNWMAIMTRTKRLTFLTAGYGQIASVFPIIVISPAYFAGAVQLGGLTQTASAFSSVQGALSFFVDAYRQLAVWSAVIERLDGFDRSILTAREIATTPPVIAIEPAGGTAVEIKDLAVKLPNGAPLVNAQDFVIAAGDKVLVTGPSGSGKSTLFRALAGIWPFGSGTIRVPTGAKVMILPQRPYFPIATLTDAIAYPAEPGTYDTAAIGDLITAVGLPALALRLDEEAHWNRMLSLGEQQRLGIARALLLKPDYLFLDEATASLDEAAEASVYRLLAERLPGTTIVSIGHRSTLTAFHSRRVTVERQAEGARLSEEPAAH
ncbi:ABC transporter ATP-binding protein/permease [Undibacter mobilis]|uniref:ABC transporter ATP-binding protein/permease n=1 Tax=Undibacter mobilis TaxID=2292256 RepID=A0A371BBA5_9BRAD|nr:ABC transporter ATP-binding protein/permease [Undibacter mobilis]RDV04889.1 ABC transporter ATP-binding protein/permease [Undibacter mobilis]